MLMPLSNPLTPPSPAPVGTGPEPTAAADRAENPSDVTGSLPPIETSAQADTGNEARSEGGEERPRVPQSEAAGPTPYVAPPTVDAEYVADAISAAETRARLEGEAAEEAAAEQKAAEARSYTETAKERAVTEERIASIVPAPENAPSISRDAASIAAALPETSGTEA